MRLTTQTVVGSNIDNGLVDFDRALNQVGGIGRVCGVSGLETTYIAEIELRTLPGRGGSSYLRESTGIAVSVSKKHLISVHECTYKENRKLVAWLNTVRRDHVDG